MVAATMTASPRSKVGGDALDLPVPVADGVEFRCGGLTPAAVAPPRGRVRRAGRRPRRARAAQRGKGACKQVRFSWSPPLFSPWGGARSEMELFAKIRAVSRYGRAEILALLPRSSGARRSVRIFLGADYAKRH